MHFTYRTNRRCGRTFSRILAYTFAFLYRRSYHPVFCLLRIKKTEIKTNRSHRRNLRRGRCRPMDIRFYSERSAGNGADYYCRMPVRPDRRLYNRLGGCDSIEYAARPRPFYTVADALLGALRCGRRSFVPRKTRCIFQAAGRNCGLRICGRNFVRTNNEFAVLPRIYRQKRYVFCRRSDGVHSHRPDACRLKCRCARADILTHAQNI